MIGSSPGSKPVELSWADACARRLERHGLAEPVPVDRLAAQVDAMCGAHAQVMSAAELSIALRVAGSTRETVQQALWVDRSIVKTHGPRGTVHLLAAKDLPIWMAAMSQVVERPRMPPGVALSAAQTDDIVAAIDDALRDAELTSDELTEAVVSRTGAWAGERVMPAFQGFWPRWMVAIQAAAFRGALCFGPNRERKVTYTSPRRWVPGFDLPAPARALGEIARRYLHAYGPATPAQFGKWLGVPRPRAVEMFQSLGAGLEPVSLEGIDAWVVAGDTERASAPPSGLRLLPYFDAYGVGCYPRERLFPGRAGERALTGGQAGNVPILLVDGVVAGVWHQRRSGRKLAVTVEPFETLTGRQRGELDEQVDRVAQIQDARPELSIGTVTVGPHA